jgi:hypothetical protein
MLFRGLFSGYHSLNCLIDEGARLGAFLVVTSFSFQHDALMNGGLRSFIENGPLQKLLSALNRDFGQGKQIEFQSLFSFFECYPQHLDIIKEIGFDTIFQDVFWQRCKEAARDFVTFNYQLSEPLVVLDANSSTDALYQQKLKSFIKDAFLEIYRNDTYAGFLSENGLSQEGKEALSSFLPEIYLPLARYAQLKEIEADTLACPESFHNERLSIYNGRRQELLECKQNISHLSRAQRQNVVTKLLKGDAINTDLLQKITALALPLLKGTLMSLPTFDYADQSSSSINLFQQACMEAANAVAG